jgi:RND superfamily putative drug exporter
MYFLRSFAYAGLAVVTLAAVASIVILPALLALIGTRINALDLRVAVRKALRRPAPAPKGEDEGFWFRLSHAVMRRPLILGTAVAALLLLLGSPFLRANFGYPDDRVLTTASSARSVGDTLRDDFTQNAAAEMIAVVPDTSKAPAAMGDYTARVSQVDGVITASSPAGTYADGQRVGGASPAATSGKMAMITVETDVNPFSDKGDKLVTDLRGTSAPWKVQWSGAAAFNADAMTGLKDKLPLAIGLIALATFVVLFLFTGSIVVPLKALVLNTLSLTATFGAMVWVSQDGHLSGLLGFTPTGYLVANMVILMFCLAFGMSMDYEVFLLSRIREAWVQSAKTHDDNTHAVALGLARTGRIVTAAAALMAIVFAAMVSSTVTFMQLFGLGLTIAVLTDATLVRGVLVPAFMRLMGRANWWAPAPLARLHDRFGLSEEVASQPSPAVDETGAPREEAHAVR